MCSYKLSQKEKTQACICVEINQRIKIAIKPDPCLLYDALLRVPLGGIVVSMDNNDRYLFGIGVEVQRTKIHMRILFTLTVNGAPGCRHNISSFAMN